MDDIRRADMRLFLKELAQPSRLLLLVPILIFLYLWAAEGADRTPYNRLALMAALPCLLLYGTSAWSASVRRRFQNARMRALWRGCEDRLTRFEEVLKRMRRDQVADLREMPQTIRNVGQSLYAALRRADWISQEVQASERNLYSSPPSWTPAAQDAQSVELYRIADKNIAEYRTQFAGVMAGVERTEAQSAVFMTTLDSLRMKMIGHRLVGRSPDLSSHEFLSALAEARAQLQAIDHALDELDLSHYPKSIAAVGPPPVPEDALRQRLGQ
jgi:hypothetical protein